MSASSNKVHPEQENVSKQTNELARRVKLESSEKSVKKPPHPPRSAFICFKDAKKKQIMAQNGITEENDALLRLVAKEWKELSAQERSFWDEEARNDKVRYVREKASFSGPFNQIKRRAKKNPLAPKRPMSAFLKYSQKRRSVVKEKHPDLSNTDVSRLLGEMWRNESKQERAPYIEQEEKERALYKEQIQKFRGEQAKADAANRTTHKDVQKSAIEYPQQSYNDGNSFNFDSLRMDTVEEAANRADQRMMFRHPYGAPAPPYHPSWDYGSHHTHAHTHGYYNQTDYMPIPQRPFPPVDDDDDLTHPGQHQSSNYFDGMNFSFYNGYL